MEQPGLLMKSKTPKFLPVIYILTTTCRAFAPSIELEQTRRAVWEVF